MHKKRANKYITFLILLPCLLLQGCWLANMPVYVPPHVPAAPEIDEPPVNIVEQTLTAEAPAHGRFTLRYEPAGTLNPILALNRDNIGITSLLYESLFVLDDRLRAVSLLCDTWESADYVTFTFTILPNIPMHDGSTLTADDVAYSIRQARQRGRHRNKLGCINSVSSDGELTVTINLKSANVRFTRLLDVPIIKADSIESDLPPGTGPYIFPNPNNLMLTPFTNHRNYASMPLSAIYLQVCNDSDLTELFDQGSISLLWEDPTSSFEIRVNRDHDAHHYNTTVLQFLGFNANSDVLRNADVRRAIGCAIDRQYIVDTIMNTRPLQAIAAPVAISPVFNMYDEEWERRMQDPLVEMAALLERAGIEDFNADGYLEILDVSGTHTRDFTLTFLVNIENSRKVEAAEHIAAGLRQVGFDIDVLPLSWNAFISALDKGDFDIYYGEVQLGADFDFSPMLLPGDSSLNYGRTAHTVYESSIKNFLAAETQDEVSLAGKQLCDEIRVNAPFVPILYKRHVIYTPLGVVTDPSPTQSGVFYNFRNWDIDLEMLT